MSFPAWWYTLLIVTLPMVYSANSDSNVGFGLELILAKLESLEYEMMTLKEQNRNLTDLVTKVLSGQMKSCGKQTEKPAVKQEVPKVSKKNQVANVIESSQPDPNEPEIDEANVFSSCFEVPAGKSGKFMIRPAKGVRPFEVFCEMQLNGGGWTMIQNRFNGSVNFYRNWTEYKNGFGSLDGEFWFGLDRIHLLTNSQPHEVLFVLMDFSRNMRSARFSLFAIGNENEGYPIKELGNYTGSAGDSLSYHKGMKFTTYDVDNDKFPANCAKKYYGAWWYHSCFKSNLNGKYINARNDQAMCWNTFSSGNEGLLGSKIMIRVV